MSVGYSGIQWNRHKRVYDAVVVCAIVLYIGVFVLASKVMWSGASTISDEVVLIRATGTCAIVLLHVILCVGPLARLWPQLLPIVYNRRHLGVMTFLVALVHGVVVTGYYHGFGVVNPLVSLLSSSTRWTSLSGFPFEALGVAALVIIFLMAATSHDFWLKNLSAVAWKRLHMLVYVAYALLIGHVALGVMQNDRGWLVPGLVFGGLVMVCVLHVIAGVREARKDGTTASTSLTVDGVSWIDVGLPESIPESRAVIVCAGGERIAVFKHQGAISAVTNVCAHQGGPLGEGKVIDGCITCPWHGWQYRPSDGRSPPPFQETIATYPVRITAGRVQVSTRALPAGTPTTPVMGSSTMGVQEPTHG